MNSPLFEYQQHVYSRTGWFPAHLEPNEPGVYERNYADPYEDEEVVFNYWDGTDWFAWASTPTQAFQKFLIDFKVVWMRQPWRGLTKPVMETLL